MSLLVIKILVTMGVVIGLSLLAERVSARLAGVLAGYPLGIAIVLCFLGLEQGLDFASQAAVYAVAGLSANVLLALAYWHIAKRGNSLLNVFFASLGGVGVFLVVAAPLQFVSGDIWLSVPFTLLLITAAMMFAKGLPVTNTRGKAKIAVGDMLFRAGLATITVLLITGTASVIGPAWAGLLAGFPVVAFPLFIILHYHYGVDLLTTTIKAYPMGLLSLLFYTTSVALSYPHLGLLWGTLLGFALATLYLLVVQKLKR